jgi:hypothetical protein
MKWARFVFAALLGVAFSATPLYAAVPPKFSFPVAKAAHPLPLDPALTDPAWAAGKLPNGTGPWWNITTMSPSGDGTTAYFLYDDAFLYVAFVAEQPNAPILASQSTNDVGFGTDDFVGIGISTGVGSQAYYFETTPRAVRYEQASENVRYRPRWRAAAAVNGRRWTAVMAIPVSALRIGGGNSQTWHVQFLRQVAARGEHLLWAYGGLMQDAPSGQWPSFYDVRFWPTATDIKLAAPRGHGRADVYGLESAGQDRNLFAQANGVFAPMKVRYFGLDVSYPITPTINFVGTADPDFSNVEIDQQTIVPQEFARQLVEYRPFFAQGASFINANSAVHAPVGPNSTAPDLVFYSPDIGPFDWGVKSEGTFGSQAFGALAFRGFDQTTGNTFSDQAYGYQHADPNGTFTYWSDGVFAHHSLAGNDATMEGGVEHRNYRTGFIQLLDYSFENGSWVPQGHADLFDAFLDVHRVNYEASVGYIDVSPNYNPIDGYTANSDIRGPQGFVNFDGTLPGIKNWSLFVLGDRFVDGSGAVHQADVQTFFNATFKDGFSIDGAGGAFGQLRSYGIPQGPGCSGPIVAQSAFTGFPCYRDGTTQSFNLAQIPLGYGDGTPTPVDVAYSWGPFGGNYDHLVSIATSRPLWRKFSLGVNYSGTYERSLTTGVLDSQWLRAVSLGVNLGPETTFSVGLRDINGYGGFATQIGNNLSFGFHNRFADGNEIYANYGSPAAGATINRFIVKYVFHAGADAGT